VRLPREDGIMAPQRTDKYIVSELKVPEEVQKTAAEYAKRATRILWLDDSVVEGAFQMNTAWYINAAISLDQPHTHESDEILGFFSGDPEKPWDLGAEIELWIDGEEHIITKSFMAFIPAGMKHCPLRIRRVDRPFFHFSTVTGPKYELTPES
jgi:hypothetical protein